MAVIKRKSIPGGTLKLKKLKNTTDLSSNPNMYVVEFPDGDRTAPRFTKENGIREFKRVARQRSGGGGFGGFTNLFR